VIFISRAQPCHYPDCRISSVIGFFSGPTLVINPDLLGKVLMDAGDRTRSTLPDRVASND